MKVLQVAHEFYTSVYCGNQITAQDWVAFSRDAAAYVDELTRGRITADLPDELLERCRMAVCAVAEVCFGQAKGGEVASASNDGYSETYVVSGQTFEQRKRQAAACYLGSTGLLYRGVNC